MINYIRKMDREQRERLLDALAASPRHSEDLDEGELLDEVIRVVREALHVPKGADLPEYARRRLVEVAQKDFGLEESFDRHTDAELARRLVERALEVAARLAKDSGEREEFAKFLRTSRADERYEWLMDAERVAAMATEVSFDRAAVSKRVGSLLEGPKAYETTAAGIVSALGSATVQGKALSGMAAGTALAGPIGAVAGGMYMSGLATALAKSDAQKAIAAEAKKERQRRARRSRLVQKVVALSAFLATNVADESREPVESSSD